jgi:cell division transport system permease protein
MILGFTGALISVLLLTKAYTMFSEQIYEKLTFLPLIPKYPFLTYITIVLIVVGTLIGALGSTISLKRFMKV